MAANVIAKRYRGADTAGALDMEDINPQVNSTLAQSMNIDTKHVAEIVVGICNPARYGKTEDGRGLRWCDNFTADRTAVYYTWDKPNTNTCWPQVPGQNFTIRHAAGNGGTNTMATIPARNSALQLSNFLFMSSLRRTIRENKNPTGAYTTYDWYSTNGFKDFIIAQPGNNNTATTQIIPGGASYSGNLAAVAGGSGYQNAMSYAAGGGTGGFGNVNPAASVAPYTGGGQTLPTSSFLPMHGQFLPGQTFGGRSFIWNDGYSGIGGSPQVQNTPASGTAPALTPVTGPVGTWIDSTDSTYSAGDMGDLQQGALVIMNGSGAITANSPGQVPAGQNFEVNIWRYNNKQPVLYCSRSGAVGAANTYGVMFFTTITFPDYYAIEITLTGASGTKTPSGRSNVQIWQINTGEFWGHYMTTQFQNGNFSNVVSSRCFGNSLLCTQATSEQYIGGLFGGVQPPLGTEWQYAVNNTQATDPYSYVLQQLGEVNKDLKHGAYGFVRPSSDKQMKWQTSIIPIQGTTNFIFSEALANQGFYVLTMVSNGGQFIQQLQLSFDESGEFVTRNQMFQTAHSRFTPEQWGLACRVLASMTQTYENPTHEKVMNHEIMMNGMGAKRSISQKILHGIKVAAPLVMQALPLILAAL